MKDQTSILLSYLVYDINFKNVEKKLYEDIINMMHEKGILYIRFYFKSHLFKIYKLKKKLANQCHDSSNTLLMLDVYTIIKRRAYVPCFIFYLLS